ncbi:hypothetical protein BH23CHL2_BH23CHL2_24540 [soil metagenome]
MIRLAPPDFDRLETAGSLDISIGGTESNVAVGLARLGRRATWISALPANPLGRRIAATLRFHGVDTSQVIWTESSRAGVYFLEPGSSPRPTRVIYDRANSALAMIDPESFPYELVDSARLLHLTGITPALSDNCADVCRRLIDRAGNRGVPLVFDVNYRALLWSPEEAAGGIQEFLDHADLLFCGQGDAGTIWGMTGEPDEIAGQLLDRSAAAWSSSPRAAPERLFAIAPGTSGISRRRRSTSSIRLAQATPSRQATSTPGSATRTMFQPRSAPPSLWQALPSPCPATSPLSHAANSPMRSTRSTGTAKISSDSG